MVRIDNPKEYLVYKFDGVTASAVYVGGLTDLKKADTLTWHEDKEASKMCGIPTYVLTLDEIRERLQNQYGGSSPLITVIIDNPLSGWIIQYGNYGDEWWKIGETGGYA